MNNPKYQYKTLELENLSKPKRCVDFPLKV